MAELLSTKINGTLNVNECFKIDENGNLTLKLKNDVGDRLTVNSNGLILNTDFKMQSGAAFLNTINTESTTGIDVQALLQINNSLKINSSASFISDAEFVVKNNITTNSLKIKYDDNNIILDANKDSIKINSYDSFDNKLKDLINIYKRSSQYAKNAGIKLYGDLFVYNGYNEIFNINNNDSITFIKNAKISNLSNSEKYLMNYKNYEKTAKAKLTNNSYNKFTLTNGYNDHSSFTKNNKIEIKEDSTGKKLITTIKEIEHISGTTTTEEKNFTTGIDFYDINDLILENPDLETAISNGSDIIVKAYFGVVSEGSNDISEIQLSSENQFGGNEAYILINLVESDIYNYYDDIIRITDPITDEEILTINSIYHNFNGNLIIRAINNNGDYDNTFNTLKNGNIFILTNSGFHGQNGSSYDLKFIYNYTTTVGEKYNIITNDYAAGFADYSKNLDLTIRKIYDYTMFDIQKNDSSILNITGEDVNINKPLTINSDTTINTEYSGITINDGICDSLFNYNLVLKKPNNYENVSNDENWYLVDNVYSSYNIGSQVKINNIVHDIELRDVYSYVPTYPSISSTEFNNIKGKLTVQRTAANKLQIYNYLNDLLEVTGDIFDEGVGKPKIRLFIKLTTAVIDILEKKVSLPYVYFKYTNKFVNAKYSTEVILERASYEFSITDLYESNIISSSADTILRFQLYQINKAIIFKDDYTYNTGDKIYYRESTSSHNLLNINTRKGNNFLTIKTDNKININGELYENDSRVYTDKTFHLYEALISIDITKTDTTSSKALYKDSNNNDLTFSKVFLRAKRIVPERMTLENDNDYGVFFKIGDKRVTTAIIRDCDLAKSYLLNNDGIMCDIYSINSEAGNNSPDDYGISYIRYRNVPKTINLDVVTDVSSFDPNFGVTPTTKNINYTPTIENKSCRGLSVANGRLNYLFPWHTSGIGYYSFESSVYNAYTTAEVKFIGSNSTTNANMTLKISIENRKIC